MSGCCAHPSLVSDSLGELVCSSCGHVYEHANLVSAPRSWPVDGGADDWESVQSRLSAFSKELRVSADVVHAALRLAKTLLPTPPSVGSVRLECNVACCVLLAARMGGEGGMLTLREVAVRAQCAEARVLQRWREMMLELEARPLAVPAAASAIFPCARHGSRFLVSRRKISRARAGLPVPNFSDWRD